ncbi:MAG: DUF4328 domain-containing protein [Phycisphaerales bacterium JB059]
MNLASYRPSSGLVTFLCLLLGANALLRLVGAGGAWLDIEMLGKYTSFEQISEAEFITAGVRALILITLSALVFILPAIVFCVWIVRAAKNARALGAQGMTVSPGWAAGWFFVPIANLFMPFKGVCEIYKASEPALNPAQPEGWKGVPVPALLGAWWALWVISMIVNNASFSFGPDNSIDTYLVASWVSMGAQTVSMFGAFAALGVVRLIHDRQQHRAHVLSQNPALAQTDSGSSSFLPHAPAA